jgi:hypothetical protein
VEIHFWGPGGDELSRLKATSVESNEIGRIFRVATERNTDLVIIT